MRNSGRAPLEIEENGHSMKFTSVVASKLCETGFLYIFTTVNSIMLSSYSKEAVAISSISGQIVNLIIIFLNMIITGAVIHISISLGGGNRKRAGNISGTASIVIFILSLISAAAALLFSKNLLVLMNVESYMLDTAIVFFKISIAFLPMRVLMNCFNNFLLSNGYASYTLLVGVAYNLMNICICAVVLYSPVGVGVDKVFMVAVSNGISCTLGFILAVGLFKIKKCPYNFICRKKDIKDILRFGVPGGMNYFSYHIAQTFTTAFIALLGVSVFNTKVYISNIVVYSSLVSYAIAQAGAIFTGRYRGREDYAAIDKLYKQNMIAAVLFNFFLSFVIYLFRNPLVSLFTSDSEVICFAGKVMLLDIVVEIFRAINQVSDQAMNASGDVKTTFFVSTLSCWLCSVGLSYLFGIKLNMGLFGVWLAFLLDEGLKSVLYLIRWKSGKWKYIRI